jgi:hypothetical protein
MMWTTIFVLSSVTLLAGGYGVRKFRAKKPEKLFVFRCTRCGQKLRYQATKAGKPGMCPSCGKACVLPDSDLESAHVSTENLQIARRVGQVHGRKVRQASKQRV